MIEVLSKVLDFLKVNMWVFKPSFWSMLSDYSTKTEKLINDIMHNKKIRDDFIKRRYHDKISHECLYINLDLKYNIWLSNYPYGYASVTNEEGETRPSRKTVYEFKKFIDNIHINYPELLL